MSLVWVCAVGWGARQLLSFSFTAGSAAATARHWPGLSAVPRSGKPFHLVVALHPRCSCSHATLGALEPLLFAEKNQVQTTILLYRPAQSSVAWADTSLRKQAGQLPGAQIIDDLNGKYADQFGATTSGQAWLYSSATGALLFAGGVTSARGHWGPSRGQDALAAILHNQPNGIRSTPIFGCAIGR